MDEEAFRAWLEDCQQKLNWLRKEAVLANSPEYAFLADKLLTPWYHFHSDWIERKLLEKSGTTNVRAVARTTPSGSDSGVAAGNGIEDRSLNRSPTEGHSQAAANTEGTPHQRGGSATAKTSSNVLPPKKCVDCKKEFVPKFASASRCLSCWRERAKKSWHGVKS